MNYSDSLKYLNEYLESHSTAEDEVLEELRRYTFLNAVHPRMISGPVQGKFIELLSIIKSPRRILEIGTFTGYSAICLAKGLEPGGELISIDVNDELQEKAKVFFVRAGLADRIRCLSGDALDIVPGLEGEFDMIFIDGEKEEYTGYFECCVPKLKKGGILLVDNVLWDGKVLDPSKNTDSATQSIISFNKLLANDKRLEKVIIPLRDGLSMAVKI